MTHKETHKEMTLLVIGSLAVTVEDGLEVENRL